MKTKNEWSEGRKWLMGILSAVIVASLVAGVNRLAQTGDSNSAERRVGSGAKKQPDPDSSSRPRGATDGRGSLKVEAATSRSAVTTDHTNESLNYALRRIVGVKLRYDGGESFTTGFVNGQSGPNSALIDTVFSPEISKLIPGRVKVGSRFSIEVVTADNTVYPATLKYFFESLRVASVESHFQVADGVISSGFPDLDHPSVSVWGFASGRLINSLGSVAGIDVTPVNYRVSTVDVAASTPLPLGSVVFNQQAQVVGYVGGRDTASSTGQAYQCIPFRAVAVEYSKRGVLR